MEMPIIRIIYLGEVLENKILLDNTKIHNFSLQEKLVAPLIATPKWVISNEDIVTQKEKGKEAKLQVTR